jgi:broad specificity phosphatase PhoE
MHFSNLLLPLLATLASAQTVYLIRNGEKPADGGNGLNAQGVQRAQCLRNVFGASSQYDIGYIIAEQPKSSKFSRSQGLKVSNPSFRSPLQLRSKLRNSTNVRRSSGKRTRPLDTVQPLATNLGLTVDTSCDRNDPDCVDDLIKIYGDSGAGQNILICWEHDALTDISKTLGGKNVPSYPDDS